MIAVLESIEKLPVYNYDSPGAGYGLQVSTAFADCYSVSRTLAVLMLYGGFQFYLFYL